MNSTTILRAKSIHSDVGSALKEITEALSAQEAKLILLFFRPDVDLAASAPLFEKYLGKNTVACSSAGEIFQNGYEDASIVGVAFHGNDFSAEILTFENLRNLDESLLVKIASETSEAALRAEENRKKMGSEAKSLALYFIDGLCGREELLTGWTFDSLKNIPLVGGSSGDGLNFKRTQIFAENRSLSNGAALVILTTTVPFEVFKIQHFSDSSNKLVITRSDPRNRIVYEINGEPAAVAYAKLLGKEVSELSSKVYSQFPLMLKLHGEFYIRSIQKANPDNSLTFYCAIDDGIVLTLADRKDFYTATKEAFNKIKKSLPNIQCSIFFECILRRLEVLDFPDDTKRQIFDLYSEMSPVGFHTYGEQFESLHINQTLTGVVFALKK